MSNQRTSLTMAAILLVLAAGAASLYFITGSKDYFIPAGMLLFAAFIQWWFS